MPIGLMGGVATAIYGLLIRLSPGPAETTLMMSGGLYWSPHGWRYSGTKLMTAMAALLPA